MMSLLMLYITLVKGSSVRLPSHYHISRQFVAIDQAPFHGPSRLLGVVTDIDAQDVESLGYAFEGMEDAVDHIQIKPAYPLGQFKLEQNF